MSTVRWFGHNFRAAIYEDCPRVKTPVGRQCVHCKELIVAGDDGFLDAGDSVLHRACFLRSIVGSINHQLKICSCFVPGAADDPIEGLTVREEAENAVAFYDSHL